MLIGVFIGGNIGVPFHQIESGIMYCAGATLIHAMLRQTPLPAEFFSNIYCDSFICHIVILMLGILQFTRYPHEAYMFNKIGFARKDWVKK